MKPYKLILLSFFLLIGNLIFAQKPTEVPKPSEEPIDLTNPADIIIYIVLPACAVLLYFIYRNSRKKKNK
ncbi:adenylosuccinate synthetase [Aequorivita sp. F47161]|uniref:Adenylosuccinate synthetase n=1 Tax=Aequorivita vitellina TaxID=2874475 RepID=A0A9X1QSQ4_9FLAO|nr:adenylosuccinate synthetase [Aequorivita vitellina]MCG2418691.1 adenylosuccinate synthetase [Aequorivita vitellina]